MIAAPDPRQTDALLLVIEPIKGEPGRWRYGFPYDGRRPTWCTLTVVGTLVAYDDPEPGWVDGVAGDIALAFESSQAINLSKSTTFMEKYFLYRWPAPLWPGHLARKMHRPLSDAQRRHVMPSSNRPHPEPRSP